MSQTQNFENHAKFVPAFHFVVLPILIFNFVWCAVLVVRHFSFATVASLLVSIALFLLALTARTFALTVQDRVIRLETRLRLQELLPPDLRGRIPGFTVSQLVSLRFASDAELPALARKVLDERVNDRKQIKKLIRDWQPDLLRA